jgi:hypothetical protein
MTALTALWLPILVSAVLVFVASSIIHMATPWHNSDYPRLPNEAAVLDALRPLGIPPGTYMAPRGEGKEMQSAEFQEKLRRGPVVMLTVLPNGSFNMGPKLAAWFGYSVVVGLLAAYLASRVLAPGAAYLEAFRFAGTTAFVGYSVALWQFSIWYNRPWSITIKSTIDGLLYGLLTGGTFGWLWPSA